MTNNSESEVRQIIEKYTQAVRDKNMEAVLANHSKDIVMFDVPPPLQWKGIDEYKKTWEMFFEFNPGGEGSFDIDEMKIKCSDSLAFAYGIVNVGTFKVRLTMGFCKLENKWMIVHEHHSYPSE